MNLSQSMSGKLHAREESRSSNQDKVFTSLTAVARCLLVNARTSSASHTLPPAFSRPSVTFVPNGPSKFLASCSAVGPVVAHLSMRDHAHRSLTHTASSHTNAHGKHARNNRVAKESDVATAVAFLAADSSEMITGTSMMVDGGWTAQ